MLCPPRQTGPAAKLMLWCLKVYKIVPLLRNDKLSAFLPEMYICSF